MSTVLVDVKDNIATVTLNTPESRNAMTEALGETLGQQLTALDSDPEVLCIVVTGAGSAFSAGGDLAMLQENHELDPAAIRNRMRSFYGTFLAMRNFTTPVVAAINGHAIGAGLCFALACDIRVVSESAKLALNFVKLGLSPGMGATYLTSRLVGLGRAQELILTGRMFSGSEAANWGLASRAVPQAEVLSEAMAIAQQITANGPLAVSLAKLAVNHGSESTLEASLEREAQAQAITFPSEDFAEGLQAIREKRTAKFSGN